MLRFKNTRGMMVSFWDKTSTGLANAKNNAPKRITLPVRFNGYVPDSHRMLSSDVGRKFVMS